MVDPSLYSPFESESPSNLITSELDCFYSNDIYNGQNMSGFKKPSNISKMNTDLTSIKLEIDTNSDAFSPDNSVSVYSSGSQKAGLISPSVENLTMDKCVEYFTLSGNNNNVANINNNIIAKYVPDDINKIKAAKMFTVDNINAASNNNNVNYNNLIQEIQETKCDPSKLSELTSEMLSMPPEEYDYFGQDSYIQPNNVDLFDGELLNFQHNYQNGYNNISDDNVVVVNSNNSNINSNANAYNGYIINTQNNNSAHNDNSLTNNETNNNNNINMYSNNNSSSHANTFLNYTNLQQHDFQTSNNINNGNGCIVISNDNQNNTLVNNNSLSSNNIIISSNNNNISNSNNINLVNLGDSDDPHILTLNVEDLKCLLENTGDRFLLEIIGDQLIFNTNSNGNNSIAFDINNNSIINNDNNNANSISSSNNLYYFTDSNDNNILNDNNNVFTISTADNNNNNIMNGNVNKYANNSINAYSINNNIINNSKEYHLNYLPTSPPTSAKKITLQQDDINSINNNNNIMPTVNITIEKDDVMDDEEKMLKNEEIDEDADEDNENNTNKIVNINNGVRVLTYDKPNLRKRRKRQISEASSCFTDDDASEFIADLKSNGSQQQRYFWQYNVLSKGPKGRRLCHAIETSDPHVLGDFEDPVFHQELQDKYKHNGKARRGDGNDVTPNPQRLFNTGVELQKLNKQIMLMAPSNDWPTAQKNKVIRERNKLASRACRLKKKAQHEANKLKLHGLKLEHTDESVVFCEEHGTSPSSSDCWRGKKQQQQQPTTVAGKTADYVNNVLDKVALGDKTGGINAKN
ncbi:hypothetical protein HELRODRAFT_167274 [Helobdella robusta]|uniref:BZIP domain-containing protein n=1 Tax=Helobdella robusta TaxID=6412 RepID=T1EZ76_HELRO|nr:hypothetical protein HELRODRAFT_167274 [Helobdella robusta]ESO10776.1 hypothetical protein HELRODRAFT_167274 [Helobdella robusta]